MKILLVVGLVCFFSNNIFASTFCSDTLPQEKPYKISRQQFLEKYGKDDTAKAIINYYFAERRTALWITIITGVIAILSGIELDKVVANHPAHMEIGNVFFILALAGFTWMTVSFALIGVYLFLHNSRKRLLKILNNYFNGKGIPSRLRKQIRRKLAIKTAVHGFD